MHPFNKTFGEESRRSQRGATLVVSLILLAVLTLLALTASQSTRMQERMAGNSRNSEVAFEAAEAGVRNGENYLIGLMVKPVLCATPPCAIFQGTTLPVDLSNQTSTWWSSKTEYGAAGSQDLAQSAVDPRIVIEALDTIPDDYADPESDRRFVYRVTSGAVGGNTSALAVVQTTFSKRYP